MSKPNRIESVYDGLLESVRRVDNFPKPKSNGSVSNLNAKDVLKTIDDEVFQYVEKANKLTVLDDEIELAECYASAKSLEKLKDILLFKLNKGE